MTPILDDATARALGVLAARPDASDEDLVMALDDVSEPWAAAARARERFGVGDAHWFRCAGDACRGFAGPPGLGEGSPCAHSDTGCQGHCEHAPVGVMRSGTRCESFARFSGSEQDLGVYLRRVAAAGHFWVDASAAEALRFDPVHDAAPNADPAPLRDSPVAFLAGQFRGRGRYTGNDAYFYKELLGTWDAGGKVLSLRMAVGFPLRDGRRDRHEALVLIRRDEEGWVGLAYTDGGDQREYRYEVESDGALCFADRAPGHGDRATRARKRLVPTDRGYHERLEVERDGGYELYSEVTMVRVGG